MLKAVILDFDGMILDTEVIWFEIYRDWFEKNINYNLPVKEFIKCVGANSDRLFDFLENERKIYVDRKVFVEETMDDFIARSKTLSARKGIVDLIKETKRLNLKLALATSASVEKPTFHLKRLGLFRYFDVLVTSDDVKRIKPFPDLFEKALEKLDVLPNEAIVFEDSNSGLEAAKKVGIPTIIIPNDITKHSNFEGYYKKVESAELVSIQELLEDSYEENS